MVFDKMPRSEISNLSGVGVDFLLQIQMGKVNYKLVVSECLFLLFDSAHRVFDRGKGFQLIGWILIWISTIVFSIGVNAREKDGLLLLRIPVKSSMGNIRYLVFNTADTVYHRVCRVQLRASPYHVLLSLDAWGVCFDRLLMEANTSAIFYGESLKFHVGLHEQGQGTQIIWMALQQVCKLLLLTVTIVRRLVYSLSWNFPGPSQEVYNTTIQARHKSKAIQCLYWFVFSTYTYFPGCCGRLLRVHRGSEYLGRIPVYRDAKGDVLLILLNKVVYMLVNFLVSIIYLLRIGKDCSYLDRVLEWRMGIHLKLVVVQDPEGLFYLSRIRTDYSCLDSVLARRMGIQLMLVIVQDPEGLSLMVSWRCAFKLFPTGVCSVRILFRFYGRVVGMHAATARANSPTALTLLFSFERKFTWFFSRFWSEENVIIVGVVDFSVLAIPILTIGILPIPVWRILTMVGLKHHANGVVRTVQVQRGDNTTCKDTEPGIVHTDLMATFKWMEVISGDLLDDPTVCIIYPISSTTTLQLVVSFIWSFTLSCVANRNWELVGIFSQGGNLDVFSRWPFITEVYAVSFDIIFIYKVRVSNAVPELLEWLASKSSIPCQVLTAEEMVNQLRHLTLNKVKTDGKRGVYALSFDMIFIYEVRVSNAVPEHLEWLASKSFISCQILEAEEIWNQLLHLIFCKVKTNGERGVCMSASQEEICEGIGPVYRGDVSTAQESRIHWLVSMGKL